jgi:nitrite reductase/ring-hydroxylating ferredoxin subunit/uncharacterized membrane protein
MKLLPVVHSVDRIESVEALDPLIARTKTVVDRLVRPQWLRDMLHGVPIGHPVHPLEAQLPLGAWASAAVLDAVPGTSRASSILVGVGVMGALPTAVAGFTDWSELHEQQQRVGIIHATANIAATVLYIASFVQRARGRQTSGKAFGYAGFAVVTAAGFLGGHLAYRQAAGVNHAEDVPHRFKPGWQRLAPLEDFADRRLEHRMIGETPLLIFREGDCVNVLSDVCSHLSGPLHEGEIIDGDDPCVVCPWHASEFLIRSGEVVGGPATAAQPRFDTRLVDGIVEVSLQGAG